MDVINYMCLDGGKKFKNVNSTFSFVLIWRFFPLSVADLISFTVLGTLNHAKIHTKYICTYIQCLTAKVNQ